MENGVEATIPRDRRRSVPPRHIARPDGDDPFIKLAFGAAAVAAVMSSVVPNVIASGAVKAAARTLAAEGMSPDAPARADRLRQSLLAVYQSSHIVGMAILEGAAFFTVFALRFGAPAWFPALTVGLLLVMAIRFPTLARVSDWIAARRAEIDAGLHG